MISLTSFALVSVTAQALATSPSSSTIVNDLQSQHYVQSPVERMRSIETACEELGIDRFDVYGDFTIDAESSYLRKFEAEVARDFGKEDAVFMPSGIMAQNIALLIHSKREEDKDKGFHGTRSFACHHSSHLMLWEQESYSKLVDMRPLVVDTTTTAEDCIHVPPMRLSDVESMLINEETKPSCLLVELPHRELGGKLTPWEDIIGIGQYCQKYGIKYHSDGARIFEASAGYRKTLVELADPFDSFYISFYKGLGSIAGAMLMGDSKFCQEARIWLTRFGGNLYTKLPYTALGWAAYKKKTKTNEFQVYLEKMQRVTQRMTTEIPSFSDFVTFDPPIPETNMLHVYFKESAEACEAARDEVYDTLGYKVFSRIRESIPASDPRNKDGGYQAYLEWTMGEANGSIDDDIFVESWKHFIECLVQRQASS